MILIIGMLTCQLVIGTNVTQLIAEYRFSEINSYTTPDTPAQYQTTSNITLNFNNLSSGLHTVVQNGVTFNNVGYIINFSPPFAFDGGLVGGGGFELGCEGTMTIKGFYARHGGSGGTFNYYGYKDGAIIKTNRGILALIGSM